MNYPRIYLAVDNCFASKRWTKPAEWMEIISSLGINHVEASADTECDPLYLGGSYMTAWAGEVKSCSAKTGVKVSNLYSGHGTYATLGLAHTDHSVRDRFLDQWLKPMVKTAGGLGAGLGFFCHAFAESVLQSPEKYREYEEALYDNLADLAKYAGDNGFGPVGLEQMYTPHQIPWTVKGAEKLLSEVMRRSRSPFYITIDVGHQSGQRKFLRPKKEEIAEALKLVRKGHKIRPLWLGSGSADKIFQAAACDAPAKEKDSELLWLEAEMNKFPHMFAQYEDGDPYRWLEELGCYSPIIHLQQTDGNSSGHQPFTEEQNDKGIIFPDRVLKSLAASYRKKEKAGMPPRAQKIWLTLEIFAGTSETGTAIIEKLRRSADYWRQHVPEDGVRLDKLI